MRRAALALVLVALFAPPASAQLRSLCTDPTMSYCFHFMTWEYTYELRGTVETEEGSVDFYQLNAETWVDLFGPGWDSGRYRVNFLASATDEPNGDLLLGDGDIVGQGLYRFTEGTGPIFTTEPGSIFENLILVQLRDAVTSEGIGLCNALLMGEEEGACHQVSVPEPSTVALLMTGLFGVVGLGRRRHNG